MSTPFASMFGAPSGLPFGVTGRDTPALPVAPGVVTAEAPWFSTRVFGAVPGATAEPAGLPSSSSPDARPFGVAADGSIPTGTPPAATAPDPAFLPPDWKPGDGIPHDLQGVNADDVPADFVPAPSVNSAEFAAQLSGSVVSGGSSSSGADTAGLGGGFVPPTYPKEKPGTFPRWMVWTLLGVGLLAAWRWR